MVVLVCVTRGNETIILNDKCGIDWRAWGRLSRHARSQFHEIITRSFLTHIIIITAYPVSVSIYPDPELLRNCGIGGIVIMLMPLLSGD